MGSWQFLELDGAATINTFDLEETQKLVKRAVERLVMVVVHGDAGLGKTFAVNHAVAEVDMPLYFLTASVGGGFAALGQDLYRAMTGKETSPAYSGLRKRLIEALQDEPCVVVIDEAQNMLKRTIEFTRDLWDDRYREPWRERPRAQFAVVFVGGPDCWGKIERHRTLSSRIVDDHEFLPLPEDEVVEIMPNWHSLYSDGDPDLLRSIDRTFGRGNFRQWAKFTDRALELGPRRRPRISAQLAQRTSASLKVRWQA